MARITRPISSRRRDRPVLVDEGELMQLFRVLGTQPEAAQVFYLCSIIIPAQCTTLRQLTWNEYDPAAGTWRLPGHSGPQAVPAVVMPRLMAMRTSEATGPVFTVQHGPTSWHPKWAEPHWGHICRQAGLYTITLHDVRHTWPTLPEEPREQLLAAMDVARAMQEQASRPPVLHTRVRVVPYQPDRKKAIVRVPARPATVIRRLRPVAPTLPPEWPG